ncbi:MAG: TonB-dependent receptor [Cytophagales bacterium]|nr:TonB-dependent receptor [Cytophagales bacterium]
MNLKYLISFILIFLLNFLEAKCQIISSYSVETSNEEKNLVSLLKDIEEKSFVKFYFLPEWLVDIKVPSNYGKVTLDNLLHDILLGTDINFTEINSNTIVFFKDPNSLIRRNDFLQGAKRSQVLIERILIGQQSQSSPTKTISFSGVVKEAKTEEFLIGVTVQLKNLNQSVVTDKEGKFSFLILPGFHFVAFNYLNHEEKFLDLEIYQDGVVTIELDETPTILSEVVIEDKTSREITTSGIGQSQISMREIKRAPALLGEVDLIKQIQILPGVTTTGEAASGFNVRGGSVDQNLILYDGLPVFNSSHVFGFFSAFNSEAVRDVTFYRGGIPASFGGRVSSVLDIRSKEGSLENWQGNGGIGIVSTNLMVQGPIKRNKTSLAASFRTTYSDWLINTVKSNYIGLENSSVTFYDGTVKLAHSFSDKTKLTLSGYLSNDQFRLQGDSTYKWQTYLTSMRLDHEFSNKLNGSLTAGVGSYSYSVFDKDLLNGFTLGYSIIYPSAKADFHAVLGSHKLNFGAQGTYYDFNPGTLEPSSDQSNKSFIQMEKQFSLETGLYVADQFDLSSKLHADLGIRYSRFTAFGPGTVNIYEAGRPIETLYQVDTLFFKKNDNIKSYQNLEPRLGFRYDLNQATSIKLGYNRIYQYLHLVSNTTAVTPIDIWQPSGYYFKPQKVDQFSLGYFKNFKDKKYEAFIEGYYKILDDVLEFKDGAQLILNPGLETDLLQGQARMFGVETQISKNVGKLNGTFSYTFSRSLRTILGQFPEETINDGKEYPSNFDQPHVVNLNWRYNISRRYFFTGSFTYRTGRPITLPLTAFSYENFTVSSFSERNVYRVPDYHRLDLGFVIEGNHKRKKFWDGTWTISIYNVYARKNAYSIFFKEARPGILRPYQLSIIGVALPSLSYSFKF